MFVRPSVNSMDGTSQNTMEGRSIAASLSNASVKFGSFTALSDISLEIGVGEFWTILGPSGCGKSTMLRLVSDLVPPATGAVEILGKTT
ncbi:MAG: NitT/TauT family transport system ATP-binding protein, partial [Dinoroseobacter sp.]